MAGNEDDAHTKKVGPRHRVSTWKEDLRLRCEQRVREARQNIVRSARKQHMLHTDMLQQIISDETRWGRSPRSPNSDFASSLTRVTDIQLADGDDRTLDLDLTPDERIELLCALEQALCEDDDILQAELHQHEEEEELDALAHEYEQYTCASSPPARPPSLPQVAPCPHCGNWQAANAGVTSCSNMECPASSFGSSFRTPESNELSRVRPTGSLSVQGVARSQEGEASSSRSWLTP